MDLILWRHAEAEEGRPDLERALTSRGRKHAGRVAKWLLERLPSKVKVISSPAKRARQTADALGLAVKVSPRLAPGASVAEILKAADWPDRKGAVVLVGHQPDFGTAAAYLVAGAHSEWPVRKGGLWWLNYRERGGEAQVNVRAVIGPDLI